jgi:hypothetical protein
VFYSNNGYYWDDKYRYGIARASTETLGMSLQLVGRGTKYVISLGQQQLVLLTLTKDKNLEIWFS